MTSPKHIPAYTRYAEHQEWHIRTLWVFETSWREVSSVTNMNKYFNKKMQDIVLDKKVCMDGLDCRDICQMHQACQNFSFLTKIKHAKDTAESIKLFPEISLSQILLTKPSLMVSTVGFIHLMNSKPTYELLKLPLWLSMISAYLQPLLSSVFHKRLCNSLTSSASTLFNFSVLFIFTLTELVLIHTFFTSIVSFFKLI